ncbi:MAG TPA: DUF1109 domain-containing protein [Rhodopseudomonas sp.]|uniref:DUF1109 domain-containing protein n=1 Tax=Rhodopseudomonas sp. TaxID=1078 RepID=UPI002EDB39A5
MKTDDLIALLSTNVEPVGYRSGARGIWLAVAAGAAAAVAAVVVVLGPRAQLGTLATLAPALLKIGLALLILVPAALTLIRIARPGGERRGALLLLAAPFVAVMTLLGLGLAMAPGAHWTAALHSAQGLECLISIPLIALVPFAVLVWTVRRLAPTDLSRAGALVGLIAGCLSATGYALHCIDDTVPFVALWYGGTIALCTLGGWLLGPRLLRW